MIEDHGPLVLCTIAGELGGAVVGDAERALRQLDLRDVTTLTIDLTELTRCDAAGIEWLRQLRDRAARSASYLVIIVGPGPVERLLALTGLGRHLTVARAALPASTPG